jgi:phosphotransferase system HPr-like phosphotransfer protein
VARHIHGDRPEVSALVLSDFNNRQIEAYVREFGRARGRPPEYAGQFFEQMERNDPRHAYRWIARNPLYLYLLVNNEPWNVEGVSCFADVINVFIQYWLHRDIAKGRSRWLLTIHDRLDFIDRVAWYMFTNALTALPFQQYDALVRDFTAATADAPDQATLSLDLQTTGVFSCAGNRLHFAVGAFQDYFVASRLCKLVQEGGDLEAWPAKVPTTDQTHLWLGLLESRAVYPEHEPPDAASVLRRGGIGVDESFGESLKLGPAGIMCGRLPAGWDWPVVNSERNRQVRTLANAWLAAARPRDKLQLHISNPLGLHMRPCAYFTLAFRQWSAQFPPDRQPRITLKYQGREGRLGQLFEILLLTLTGGETCGIEYAGCTEEDVATFLQSVGAVASPEEAGLWVMDFQGAYEG